VPLTSVNPTPPLPLTLSALGGPAIGPFTLVPTGVATVGRLLESTICLINDRVSRRHAVVLHKRSGWFVIDQGSKEGTFVNGVASPKDHPTPVGPGDILRIGPWSFRLSLGEVPPSEHALGTIDDRATARVQRPAESPGNVASRRLGLLTDCIARLDRQRDEASIARAVLDSAIQACGYARGAVLRRVESDGDVVVVSSTGMVVTADRLPFSRSLIAAASEGSVAAMSRGTDLGNQAHSIADLGIHSAICAPIFVADAVTAYLYLDARGDEPSLRPDSAAFCEALARAAGLALANIKRAELDTRERELAGELAAAREAQQFILPPSHGTVGCIKYAMKMSPGLFVAGDLFDVVPLTGERIAVVMGDVSGHGAASAMLMASAQAHLHALLTATGDVALAVDSLNRYLALRDTGGRFASLWLGVFERGGRLSAVDAGHGHWLIRRADGTPRQIIGPKSIPVGIDADALYEPCTVTLSPGERVILYSDGAVEERNGHGEFFGLQRLVAALAATTSTNDDVAAVFEAIRHFTGVTTLDDDVTIASIACED